MASTDGCWCGSTCNHCSWGRQDMDGGDARVSLQLDQGLIVEQSMVVATQRLENQPKVSKLVAYGPIPLAEIGQPTANLRAISVCLRNMGLVQKNSPEANINTFMQPSTFYILKLLSDAGIHPNGSFYSASAVYSAIQSKVTYMPGIAWNEDKAGNKQLYQIIIMCGDTAGTKIVDCLGLSSHGKCSEKIKFPSF
ncbi:unnamed protein product [Prunus armeniaca]|uniref:Uncharacterized protein n=1 Tax=Prunus armeniaca TaxID=36596 RepID=A0A6J5XA55_PRUAR|nr:unnamed protein product [Prunus armeniaca]